MAQILGRPDIEPFLRIKTITTNYTVVRGDAGYLILVNTTGGAVTVSLPALSTVGDGFVVSIKRITAGANALTIDPNGAETIEGAATLSLPTQYQAVNLVSLASSGWLLGAAPLAIATGITAGSGLSGGGTLASGVTISGAAASVGGAGVVSLATPTETIARSSSVLAVPPSGLASIGAPLLLQTLSTSSGSTVTSSTLSPCLAFLAVIEDVSSTATSNLRTAVSDDDGANWSGNITLDGGPSAAFKRKGQCWYFGTGATATNKIVQGFVGNSGNITFGFGEVASETGVTNKIRFSLSSGSFDGGSIYLYGFR